MDTSEWAHGLDCRALSPEGLRGRGYKWGRAYCVFVYRLEVYTPFKWYAHLLTLKRENHTCGQRYSWGFNAPYVSFSLPCHGSYRIWTVDSGENLLPPISESGHCPFPVLATRYKTQAGATPVLLRGTSFKTVEYLKNGSYLSLPLSTVFPLMWTEQRGEVGHLS